MTNAPETVAEGAVNPEVLTDEESTLDVFEEEVESDPDELAGADDSASEEQTDVETESGVKDVEGESPPPEEDGKQERTVPLGALVDERTKRQRAEEELRQVREQNKPAPTPVEVPDPIVDPTGYANHIANQNQMGMMQARVDLSKEIMESQHPDYAEKEQAFLDSVITKSESGQVVVTNQALFNQFQAARNPAKFMYEQGAEALRISKLKDPGYEDSLRETLRKEVMADVIAMVKEQGVNFDASTLPDFTSAAATGSNSRRASSDDQGIPDDRLDVFDD